MVVKHSAPAFAPPTTKGWTWQWRVVARALVCLESLQEAGFGGETLRQMAATWMAESGGKRWAKNLNANGTEDQGPAQLNLPLLDQWKIDLRNKWLPSAVKTKEMYDQRGFQPWYMYGTDNWLEMFPYVDVAITIMGKPDRIANGWQAP